MKVARIELHYLPSIEYFCALNSIDQIELECHENFSKQSFRNRCYINTSQGQQMLIVPVTEKHGKVSVQEIKIDHKQKWQNNHWRSIETAYRKAPFFEFYSDQLKTIFYKNHKLLFDLNIELLSFCLRSMQANKKLARSNSYQKESDSSVLDLRNYINPKETFLNRSFYQPIPYQQVFGNTFVPNLCFLDLLFCEGPSAPSIIQSSKKDLNK